MIESAGMESAPATLPFKENSGPEKAEQLHFFSRTSLITVERVRTAMAGPLYILGYTDRVLFQRADFDPLVFLPINL